MSTVNQEILDKIYKPGEPKTKGPKSPLRQKLGQAAKVIKKAPGAALKVAKTGGLPLGVAGAEVGNVGAYRDEAQYNANIRALENFGRQSPKTLANTIRTSQSSIASDQAALDAAPEEGFWEGAFKINNQDTQRRNLEARQESLRLAQMAAANQQPKPPSTYGDRGPIGWMMEIGSDKKKPPMIEGATVIEGDNDDQMENYGESEDQGNPNQYLPNEPKIDKKTGLMTVGNAQGQITATPDAHANIRQQAQDPAFLDRMVGRSMQGGDEARLSAVSEAARAAIARGESVNLDRVFGKSGLTGSWSDAQEADYQIDLLRKKLASPGRGLNQTASSYMQEQEEKRGIRQQIEALSQRRDSLLESQAEQSTNLYDQMNKDRDYSLKVAKERNRMLEKQGEMTAAESEAATKTFEEYNNKMAEFEAEGDRAGAEAYMKANLRTAKDQYIRFTRTQGKDVKEFFNTPQGQLAERATKEHLIKAVSDEEGLYDWFRQVTGLSSSPSINDIEQIDFKGWQFDKGEIVLPEWLVRNDVVKAKGEKRDNMYAYTTNMDPDFYWAMKGLICRDNPGTKGCGGSLRRKQ